MSEQYTPTVPAASLPPDASLEFTVSGTSLLLCHSDGKYFAIQNRCPHQGRPLAGGRVRRGTIACPLHGMRFELGSGKPLGQLTATPLRTFAARVHEGVIEVAID